MSPAPGSPFPAPGLSSPAAQSARVARRLARALRPPATNARPRAWNAIFDGPADGSQTGLPIEQSRAVDTTVRCERPTGRSRGTREMFTTNGRRRYSTPTFHKIVALATCTMMSALTLVGVTRPVTAEDRALRPPYDRRLLSDMAREVLRNRATGANQSVAEPSLPG